MHDLYQLPVADLRCLPPASKRLVYPAAMRAIDVRHPLYGEDLERGDLRD